MTLLFRILFWLPAWFVLAVAAAAFYFGTQVVDKLELRNQQVIAAADAAPPALTDFDPARLIPPGEVALRTRLFDDAAYRFVYENEGSEDLVEYFLFMEAPGVSASDGVFSGVVIFESDSLAQVEAWWDRVLLDPENDRDLAGVRGYAARDDQLSDAAAAALGYIGGRTTENFVFIRPFLEGRAAFYTANTLPVDMIRQGLWLAVAVLVFWAVCRHLIARRKKAVSAAGARVATGLGVASAAAGLVGLEDEHAEDPYEDEEDDEGGGLAWRFAKLLFGVFWKRRAARNADPADMPGRPVQLAGQQPAPASYQTKDQALYSPPRQVFDEYGELIKDIPAVETTVGAYGARAVS